MAQPIPIFTSPSTTLVQVDSNSLQSPYTPVILNTVAYPGQVVTVLNTLSSLAILNEPIVVSTITGTYFPSSNFSTLIQQPQGFITAQTGLSNTWSYLNSYPFRDQYISAGVQNLTTSTLFTAVTSTIQDITSSLKVENLVVSGNFFQSSGLIINTSVSSLGSVYILSSLTVLGPTEFSSSVSSISYSVFGSTFQVYGNFFSRSTIQFASSLNVSTSVSAIGDVFVSGPNRPVQLEGGLIGTTLEVQASTSKAMNVAGYFLVQETLSTLSSIQVGKELFLNDLTVTNNLSSLSSVAVYDSLIVGNEFLAKKDLSIQGTLGIKQDFLIGESLTVTDNMKTTKSLFIRDDLLSLSTLSTQYLAADYAFIQGNLAVSSGVVSTQNLFIKGSLGFQNMTSLSTTVGGNVSTLSNLVLSKDAFIEGYFINVGSISSISSFSVLQDVYTLESLSTGTSLYLSGGMTVVGKVDLLSLFEINKYNPSVSSVFEKDLSIVNSISITDTAIISSIVLPSSLVAYSFITSTMTAGYQGIANHVLISSLKTSSIATGGLLYAEQTMDMLNVLQTRNLSTFQLSTLVLEVGPSSQPSTSIQFTSSLGILTTALPNTFDINTTLYTLSNTYINKTLSSAQLFTPLIQGSFKGDGSFLSNINYPAQVSSFSLSTGSIVVEKTFLSSFLVSSGVIVDSFFAYSTLQVGDFYIYGNANQDILQSSNNMRIKQGSPTFLALNNLYMYGDTNNIVQKQVIVSSNSNPSLSNLYTLGVDGTLRLNSLLSPEFSLFIQSFYGDVIVGVNVGSLNTNTLYISSGSIGYNNVPFFVPSGNSYINLSTNIIQPSFSTLALNSTLFVTQDIQKAGINTKPFYNLDVKGETYVQQGLLVSQSTFIKSYLNINQQRSSFWLGVTSNDGFSNILYSADEGENWSYFTPTNGSAGGTILNVATNGGQLGITTSNTLTSEKLWLATTVPLAQYYREGTDSWYTIQNSSKLPQSNAGIAYNGRLWVLTGYSSNTLSPTTFPTLHWSENGINWYKANSGGFTSNGVSLSYGGRAVAWNGSLWIAVGEGVSATNSILYSGDGKNWSDAVSGGFTNGGYGVVWSGSNWITTGDNGGPLSSFCVSDDGSNWTAISGYGFNGTSAQRGNALATDGSLVVAVGSYNGAWPAKSIQYSEDRGYTWQNASGTLFDVNGYEGISVVYNGTYWLAGGTNGVRKSFDGKTWYKPSGSLTSGMFHGLSFSSNAQPILQIGASNYVSSITSTITSFNVACGVDITTMDSNCLRYSGDGMNWSNAESGYFKDQGRAAAHNGLSLWVAAGKGTASNFIYSGNGKNWSDGIFHSILGGNAIGTGVVYGGGFWVGTMDTNGGGGDTIFYSSDGSNWYATDTSHSGVEFTSAGLGVAFGNGKFTAVGTGGYTILYANTFSPPNQWIATGITNAFDTQGNGIAYGNSRWIACGQDTGGYTIKYSGDQTNWSNSTSVFPTAGYGLAYDGTSRWVAVGDGAGMVPTTNILYSDDNGVSWNNIASGDFLAKGYGVAYNQGLHLWIAAGEDPGPNKTLKYSGDGTNWSNATGLFDTRGFGIGVTSNVVSTQTTSINQLRVYNTPGFGVTLRDTTPNISYTSTSITYNNTLTLDRFKTVSIQQRAPNYISSLYDTSLAFISSFVSSQATQVGGYFLTNALV